MWPDFLWLAGRSLVVLLSDWVMKASFRTAAVTKCDHLPDKGLRIWAAQGNSPCSNIFWMSWNSPSWSLRLELHEVAVDRGSRRRQSDGSHFPPFALIFLLLQLNFGKHLSSQIPQTNKGIRSVSQRRHTCRNYTMYELPIKKKSLHIEEVAWNAIC